MSTDPTRVARFLIAAPVVGTAVPLGNRTTVPVAPAITTVKRPLTNTVTGVTKP